MTLLENLSQLEKQGYEVFAALSFTPPDRDENRNVVLSLNLHLTPWASARLAYHLWHAIAKFRDDIRQVAKARAN